MNDSNIRDITEGKMVRNLVFVFDQLDEIAGRNVPLNLPNVLPFDVFGRLEAADYPVYSLERAKRSMLRAAAQFEKGWLSAAEFNSITAKCLAAIAKFEGRE